MKYLICGILGIAIGFFVFYLLFRIANKDKLCKKLQDGSKRNFRSRTLQNLYWSQSFLLTLWVCISVSK